MKLTIKSLAGGNFTIDAEPTDTIASVKAKIADAKGHAVEQQKLIFSGKILTDDKTVQSCNIKSEKDFLVVMVSKPKAAKAAPAAAPASEASSSAPAPPAAAPATSSTETPTTAAPAAAPATEAPAATTAASDTSAASTAPGSSASFLAGSALEAAVLNMVEMGFERSEVDRAMRASFNNPDRAVEYLMTGIPEHLLAQQQPAPAAAAAGAGAAAGATPASGGAAPQTPARTTGPATTPNAPAPPARAGNLFEAAAAAAQTGGAGGAGGRGAAGRLGEDDGEGGQVLDLSNPAMLAQLRELLQQNPAALEPLVRAIAQSNPQLAEQLNANPDEVLAALSEIAGDEGGPGGEGGGMALPTLEELSPEDREAVQQIIAMGIPSDKAIEAYYMCGRNVEIAVQFYFDNPGDFDD